MRSNPFRVRRSHRSFNTSHFVHLYLLRAQFPPSVNHRPNISRFIRMSTPEWRGIIEAQLSANPQCNGTSLLHPGADSKCTRSRQWKAAPRGSATSCIAAVSIVYM